MVYNSRLGLLTKEEILKLNVFCIKIVKLNKKNYILQNLIKLQQRKVLNILDILNLRRILLVYIGEKYYSDIQIYNHTN